MIPFRPFFRRLYLSGAGSMVQRLAPAVHILNGHVTSMAVERRNPSIVRNFIVSLREHCELINIEDAVALIRAKTEVDRPMVAFTFDDGYDDCYREIAPVLHEFGVNAAFFINPNFMDGTAEYREEFFAARVPNMPSRPPMSRKMVRELSDNGFVIGAHTLDHVRLVNLGDREAERQIVDCKSAIEDVTQRACEYFAWTYGKYSDIDDKCLALALKTYPNVFSSEFYGTYQSAHGVLNRRHFEFDWPCSHLRYFLSKPRSWAAA